ncbi:hypothetical protein GWK47_051195 [Chionoecetes opilio]|uniref:Uncharacterized protein n=1 Tax=Chionoecetes opilio TaxID=41210 RepID=A0A8J4Y272_CHIOP|nr:hypothetical protein GWK47_051195 [Chionoecetes opilio]
MDGKTSTWSCLEVLHVENGLCWRHLGLLGGIRLDNRINSKQALPRLDTANSFLTDCTPHETRHANTSVLSHWPRCSGMLTKRQWDMESLPPAVQHQLSKRQRQLGRFENSLESPLYPLYQSPRTKQRAVKSEGGAVALRETQLPSGGWDGCGNRSRRDYWQSRGAVCRHPKNDDQYHHRKEGLYLPRRLSRSKTVDLIQVINGKLENSMRVDVVMGQGHLDNSIKEFNREKRGKGVRRKVQARPRSQARARFPLDPQNKVRTLPFPIREDVSTTFPDGKQSLQIWRLCSLQWALTTRCRHVDHEEADTRIVGPSTRLSLESGCTTCLDTHRGGYWTFLSYFIGQTVSLSSQQVSIG